MNFDLSFIWAVVIIFGIMMYVFMDGFDLGIGILFPLVPEPADRDVMMNTVAPVWDGNETWLVLGGAGLYAAFPMAYSVVLSALYLPVIFMVIALVFRGVAFEFRFKATPERQHIWDKAFIGGSVVAAFAQGVTLGAFLSGISVSDGAYAGGALDWLTPFSLFCGLGLVAAYALLGCTWLIMKTEGHIHQQMQRYAAPLVWAMLVVIGIISLWTPFAHPQIGQRWFSIPNIFWFSPVPLLVLLCAFYLFRAIKRGAHYAPFLLTLSLLFLGYCGLGISIWPNVIPPDISIWEAAGPESSQAFALVGVLIILPVILVYTVWSYYVFRGKVTPDHAYH